MPLRAVLFDFDGLILDTESAVYESWSEIYHEAGHELCLEEWVRCVGSTHAHFDPFERLQELTGTSLDREALRRRCRQRNEERLASEPLLPGVAERLHEARTLGLSIAVASNSTREWVGGHLRRLGIASFFGAVLTRDDIVEPKPHPEIYDAVLARLGVAPGEAVAFEDSPHGVDAARAAGIFTFAVPNPITRDLEFRANQVLQSLRDVQLASLAI